MWCPVPQSTRRLSKRQRGDCRRTGSLMVSQAVHALLSGMPDQTSQTTLEELAATGLVEIEQDMQGITLTMQRLDGVWTTQFLRPILGVLFSLLTLGGLGILYAGLDMLSGGHLSGLWLVPLSLAWTVASAAFVAGLAVPRLGYRMLGYRINLSQHALTFPGGIQVKRLQIPLDQITSVQTHQISAVSMEGLRSQPGTFLEVVTRDGNIATTFPIKKIYRAPLLALIRDHIDREQHRLTQEGHDLSQSSPPPSTLTALLAGEKKG